MSKMTAVTLFTHLLRRSNISSWDWHIAECFSNLVASNPEGCCAALYVYLDTRFAYMVESSASTPEDEHTIENMFLRAHRLREEFEKIFDPHLLLEIIGRAAQSAPEAFVEYLLPWFITVVTTQQNNDENEEDRYPNDLLFSYELSNFYSPNDYSRNAPTFTASLIRALGGLAHSNPSLFRATIAHLAAIKNQAIHSILIRAYIAHSQDYIVDIYTYLVTDNRRFNIGYNNYDACKLVGIIFSKLDEAQRSHLEEIILSLAPKWEMHNRGLGYTQILFLKSLDRAMLSPKANRRLQELELKFPGLEPKPRTIGMTMSVVSPIAPEVINKMSDENLLNAMRIYDESTGWDMPRSARQRPTGDFFKGGLVELSRVISEKTLEQPERFYRLTRQFDETIAVVYITQILSGLAVADAPTDWVFDIAERFASRFTGEERIGYCRALQKRAGDKVPDSLLDIITQWAKNDPDPDTRTPHNGYEWFNLGINTVRGVAVETVVHCSLNGDPHRSERAVQILTQAIRDPSPAVGACALQGLQQLLNNERYRATALNLCEALLKQHSTLLEDLFTYQFLSWATFHYYDRFGQYIETMLESSREHTRQEGARLATQAALNNPRAEEQAVRSSTGDMAMRCGAAHTYAMYLTNPSWQALCEQRLGILMNDDSDEVLHQVSLSFNYLKSEHINTHRDFVFAFISSPALTRETRYVIDYVKPLASDEHELALQLTEAVIRAIEHKQITNFWDDDIVSLPLAVYNRSRDEAIKHHAIDLFEQLLRLGIRGAKKALSDWDEYRDWSKLVYQEKE